MLSKVLCHRKLFGLLVVVTVLSLLGSTVAFAAAPTVSMTDVTFVYNGSAQAYPLDHASASFPGSTVIGTWSFSYSGTDSGGAAYGPTTTPPTNAGTYTVEGTITPTSPAGLTPATGSATEIIQKATCTTVVNVTDVTYNGGPQGATATTTCTDGLNPTPSISYTGTDLGGTAYGPTATAPTNAGTYTATATYAGDLNHAASTVSKTYKILPAPTTTTLTSSVPKAILHQPLTFTAVVNAALVNNMKPTGSVTFMDGATVLGTVTLVNGQATLDTATLAVGTHTITASYTPDTFNLLPSSASMTQVVAYKILLKYKWVLPKQANAAVPVRLQLVDFFDKNQSSAKIQVLAVSVDGNPALLKNAGQSNKSNYFRFDMMLGTGGYMYNLKTTGLKAGQHNLDFIVGGDTSIVYEAPFVVKIGKKP